MNKTDLIKKLLGEETKEKTTYTPPTETKGFESLVTPEEYEAIVNLKKAFDNYVDIHNEKSLAHILGDSHEMSPYSRIQYSLLSDITKNTKRHIDMLYGIHEMDKEGIDKLTEKSGCKSLEEFEYKTMTMLLLKELSDR